MTGGNPDDIESPGDEGPQPVPGDEGPYPEIGGEGPQPVPEQGPTFPSSDWHGE